VHVLAWLSLTSKSGESTLASSGLNVGTGASIDVAMLFVGVTTALARRFGALLMVTVVQSVAVAALLTVTIEVLCSVLILVATSRSDTT
jgi:hypothetical protein